MSLHLIDKAATQQKSRAQADYRRLLETVADNRFVDGGPALQILKNVGKSREDLERDVQTFRRLRDLRSQQRPIDPLTEAKVQASRDHQAALKERSQVIAEANQRCQDAQAAFDRANAAIRQQQNIIREISELERGLVS